MAGTIPVRTTAKPAPSPELGRIRSFELPGLSEQTLLQQFSSIAKSGAQLSKIFADRQDKKKKENDDLAANEAYLGFVSASRQKEDEFNQTLPPDSEGMFSRWKEEQDKIYQNFAQGLTEDQQKIFDKEAGRYGLNVNTRIAKRETKLHSQRIKDNYEGKSTVLVTQALDNYQRPDLFYKYLNEASVLKNERLKLDGVDENLIKEKDKIFKSATVKEAIIGVSTESIDGAELWFKEAKKKKELTFNDAFKLQVALDKRKKAKSKIDSQIKVQNSLDKIFANEGIDQKTVFDFIRKNTSGDFEDDLIAGAKVRFKEMQDQTAETQRKLLSGGKAIIDQSTNATEARTNVDFIMSDPNATIATAKTLEAYIDDVFVKANSKKTTNPSKLQEAYTLINKNEQGIAARDEIIENDNQLVVQFGPYLSQSDMKRVLDYRRNRGLFGKSGQGYDDILQSFANFKGVPKTEIERDKESQKEFFNYLNYVAQRLPPDKAISPAELNILGGSYFVVNPPTTTFDFVTGGLFRGETLSEAIESGRIETALPSIDDLDETQLTIANQLLVQENDYLRSIGRAAIPKTDENLLILYKRSILRLPHKTVR